MVYEVITFKKDKSVPDNGGLLSDQYGSSSISSKAKKKNLFSKFGKKKKEDGDEYQPPTAPSSPLDDTPLNVTVIPNNVNPPAPYLMNKADTAISDITMLATAHRVGFDSSTKEQTHRKTETASSLPSYLESATVGSETRGSETRGSETRGSETLENVESSLPPPSPSEGSVWNKTFTMLDDICNAPTIGKKNLDNDMAAAALPRATNLKRPAWGSVPSEDDDDTFVENSYQSTNGNSSVSRDRTNSTKASTLADILKRKTEQHTTAIPPTHENFEVVLDPTLLTAGESSISKRRGWFGKKDEEEEKKEDESHANEYASSSATNKAALVGTKPKDVEAPFSPKKLSSPKEPSSPKKPSLIKRLSMVKLGGKSKDSQGEKSEKEEVDKSSQSPVGTNLVDQPTRTSNPWNNATLKRNNPNQLQLAKEKKMANKKIAREGKKEKSSKQESRRRTQPLGPFIAAALRKKSKKDSELKSPPKSLEKPTQQKRLKPLWKAVEDHASGRTYYYHRKTRETTWKKPKELQDWENAKKASTAVNESEKEVTLQEAKSPGLAPKSPKKAPEASWPGVPITYVASTKMTDAAVVPASPTRPPAVILAESQDQNGDEPFDIGLNKPSAFDNAWEKKREINRLLTGLAPSDKASVNKIMRDSAGNEDELLRQLRDLVESQPFDEPFLDELDESLDDPPSPIRSSYSLNDRVRTHASRASATTKSSAMTGKTQKIRNTSDGRFSHIAPISESKSTATSISSNHEDDNMYSGLPPPGSHLNRQIKNNARIPSKVPAIPRNRELIIEEFTGSKAETFGVGGRVVRGGTNEDSAEDSYYGDNEVDTYGTDSVSALSENDSDLLSRKNNFNQARRRALDDAVEREDWELAAVLTEGLRQPGGSRDVTDAHNTWDQSSLNNFIANNDWNAVSGYIAQMLDGKKKEPTPPTPDEPEIPEPVIPDMSEPPEVAVAAAASIVRAPRRAALDDSADPSLKKKIGSKSQLQHRELSKSQMQPRELLSESSWTTDSSYDSYDSDYS